MKLKIFLLASGFAIITCIAFLPSLKSNAQYNPLGEALFSLGDMTQAEIVASEFQRYRAVLMTFQPEFSVEGSKMVTKAQAKQKGSQSKSSTYSVCFDNPDISNLPLGCAVTIDANTQLYFSSNYFDWYLWYESVTTYSRFAPVKTRIAKFPKGSSDSQASYAIFSYQGMWFPEVTESDFYSLQLNTGGNSPDNTYMHLFFTQHTDYPLFYATDSVTRYGPFEKLYYQNGVLSATYMKDSYSEKKLLYRRSLTDGTFLDIAGYTPEMAEQGTLVE